MVRLIQDNEDGRATVGFVRDGQELTLETSTTVNSVRSLDDREVVVEAGFLGVTPTTVREQHGLLYTAEQMGVMTWDVTQALVRLPVKVFDVAQAVVGLEERADDSPVSIVGAGRVAGEVTSDQTSPAVDRLVFLVGLLASLNLFVGMFNFIPLLPLDGGHIAGALYEGAAARGGAGARAARPRVRRRRQAAPGRVRRGGVVAGDGTDPHHRRHRRADRGVAEALPASGSRRPSSLTT